ncbi:hypothetical protein P5673_022452 [Acropora cervicornis]|uniref:Uncharacterized protein n=1 Tax=Acropora cervicornis TaxID=6130 RepID=A0AAD9Q726_ACRCE|nr:hypothetical protein P5673_022452 [Acropora cervicornis]
MQGTKAQVVLLCRQVLALEPYSCTSIKKGSNEAGKIWTDITQRIFHRELSERELPSFSVSSKRKKIKKYMPLGYPLNEIIERGKVAKENSNFANEMKEKDKATGEEK